MSLLKDSRTAARPATFPHRGGNPLRSGMAFEEVLLQEGTNHVGKLVINLYKNEHCRGLAKELLTECVGATDAQLERIHEQLSTLANVPHLDEPLIERLCRAIQTLQQRARLGRMQSETAELKITIGQSRQTLNEAAAEHKDDPQGTAQDVDGLLELLDAQKSKLLPLHEQISTSFLFDGTQFDELVTAVEELEAGMSGQKESLDARFSESKLHVKNLRKRRRELMAGDEEEMEEAEHADHSSYLASMKSSEDARKAAADNIEAEIKAAIEGMEQVGQQLQDVDAKVDAAKQLRGFIETAGEVFSKCTSEQRQSASDDREELTKQFGDDILRLSQMLDRHLTLQCKRVNLFKARLAPKREELQKLERLCLGEEEASTNRQNLETEVQECTRLIEQSMERVKLCSTRVDEYVTEYVRLRGGEGMTSGLMPPESITGGHTGSFMAQDQKDGVNVRVTVDPHGLAMYKHEAMIAFYEYKAIKSWDMSSTHFGLTPSKLAQATHQNTRKWTIQTLEGREIAKMMSANANLLVGQKKEAELLQRPLLEWRRRIADFATLLAGYADGSCTYKGELSEDGIPEGEGVLTLANGETFTGEFHNGQPAGKGKYTRSGQVYEGVFRGLRPEGGGHIYRVVAKAEGRIADVFEGQLSDFAFHGAGRLRSASSVPGMIVHYEGAFEDNKPQSRCASPASRTGARPLTDFSPRLRVRRRAAVDADAGRRWRVPPSLHRPRGDVPRRGVRRRAGRQQRAARAAAAPGPDRAHDLPGHLRQCQVPRLRQAQRLRLHHVRQRQHVHRADHGGAGWLVHAGADGGGAPRAAGRPGRRAGRVHLQRRVRQPGPPRRCAAPLLPPCTCGTI